MPSRRLRQRFLTMIGIPVVIVIVYAGAAVGIYVYGQMADYPVPADAIVILGAGVHPDGTATPAHLRRVLQGWNLYRHGYARYVICTGGYDTPKSLKSELAVCGELLQGLGVPTSAILIEENSHTTEGNAIEARRLMEANHLQTALVVTDNFHVMRSQIIFHDNGIPASFSLAQGSVPAMTTSETIYDSSREVLAIAWYLTKRLLHIASSSI